MQMLSTINENIRNSIDALSFYVDELNSIKNWVSDQLFYMTKNNRVKFAEEPIKLRRNVRKTYIDVY